MFTSRGNESASYQQASSLVTQRLLDREDPCNPLLKEHVMRNQEVRKRNNRVQVRLDNKEHQAFLKAVKRSRLSQEVYLRHLISGVVPQDVPPPDYYAMMQQLYRIGNNLNQIAQKAHTLNVIDVQRYDAAYRAFETAVEEITKAVVQPRPIQR